MFIILREDLIIQKDKNRQDNYNRDGYRRRISRSNFNSFSRPLSSDRIDSNIDESENNYDESESFDPDLIPVTNLEDISKLNDENKKCVICLEEFENNNLINTLPCAHIFHSECLKKWIPNNPNCPTCRLDLRSHY